MIRINGYQLKSELTAQNAGFCRWGFCEKNEHEFFIKEFLSPIYPDDNPELSEKTRVRKRRLCEDFFAEKNELYDVLSTCRSGNIVTVCDFFRSESRYYAVTDKINAEILTPLDIAGFNEKVKMSVICSLLYSVSLLHAAGIVHADIKPDNILFKKTCGEYYAAKLIDFDASFLKWKIPADIQGDFIYLSPEVYLRMNEEEVDVTEKIDIFALGIIIHQLWTGKLPDIGSECRYTFEAVLDGVELVLSDELPEELAGFIRRMLAENPAERPDARELFERLSPTIGESPIIKEDDRGRKDKSADESYPAIIEEPAQQKSFKLGGSVFFVPDDLG